MIPADERDQRTGLSVAGNACWGFCALVWPVGAVLCEFVMGGFWATCAA